MRVHDNEDQTKSEYCSNLFSGDFSNPWNLDPTPLCHPSSPLADLGNQLPSKVLAVIPEGVVCRVSLTGLLVLSLTEEAVEDEFDVLQG